jgi:hypothetical protein
MSTLLLTARGDPSCVTPHRSRAHHRLLAHVRAWGLDRALAAGICPDSSATLSLRAQMLISSATRRELSREIRRLLDGSADAPQCASVAVCRRKIQKATGTFEELAERLAAERLVDARGVAQVRLLLRDGFGPLYSHPRADDLEPALQSAIEALELSV